MAEQHAETAHDYVHGQMEVSAQASMFNLFVSMTKWCSLAMAALLVLLVLWFAVGAGFITGFISAAVVTAIGIFVLRGKKSEEH
ncbi:aa3-type cytochrome c oxidase subunit IV [Brevundimonas sp.]|uniref:aa3-type cytochrome c oxidase subunit IV n=1 Tax=Brevundimonas sp. TaxID=1871086 RepID=UPI002FC70A5D